MSTGVLVVVPLALVLMLAMQYVAEPSKLLQGFIKSLAEALNLCRVFIITGHRGRELLPAFLKPALYVAATWFLVGWYSQVATQTPDPTPDPTPPPVNAVYVVSEADRVRQAFSVHLLVHFDNAAIEDEGELAERGVSLDDPRTARLRATVEALGRNCATAARGVSIRPYGFASDDKFRGLPADRSDELNVEVANLRGKVVHEALKRAVEDEDVAGVTVEPPIQWRNLTQMTSERNSRIRLAAGNDRNAFADRVVVLFLSDSGECRIQQSVSAAPGENTAASAGD